MKKLIHLKLISPYLKELEAQMQELHIRLPEKNRRLYTSVETLKKKAASGHVNRNA